MFVASLLLQATPVAAQSAVSPNPTVVVVGATTLDVALISLARQTGTEIVSTAPGLAAVRVAPIAGRLSAHAALDRLLAGTEFRAIAIDGGGYRIVRGSRRPVAASRTPSAPPPAAPSAAPNDGDIVVTASKQHVPLSRYPGSITVIQTAQMATAAAGPPGIDDLARASPVLQTTALGPGRDKVFIRGIADSSFNGATQSTASVYFGDVQLAYSGAEPGIVLSDMQRVEIMEGPQGTLYGAGSIGGVIRLTPNPVDLGAIGGQVAGGLSTTAHGAIGYDLSGHLNVPISSSVGLRVVGYDMRDSGYIDDTQRRLADVNRTETIGGRAALRVDPGNGWSIEASGIGQHIASADAQYADAPLAPLTRQSSLAQPFSNTLFLGRVVVSKRWDSGLELLSATGVVDYRSLDIFDATLRRGAPLLYSDHESNTLLTQETRLSRSLSGGSSWLVGFALLQDSNTQSRLIGPIGNPTDIIGVTNISRSVSLFGEATVALSPQLSVTGGLRGTTARLDSDPSSQPRSGDFVHGRRTARIDPTIALSWALSARLSAFARVQSGYRTGGLAVARGIGRVAEFQSDSIRMGEAGFRLVRRGATGLSLSTALSFADWSNIQADLVDRRGLPYTANIGNAQILALEANGDWVPLPGLHATFATLYTYNRVTGPLADLSVRANRRLPETPDIAGNAGSHYVWAASPRDELRAGGSVQYVGRSVLGTGDFLDISQGRYTVAGIDAGWKRGRFDTTFSIDNLFNAKANRFALGNPFLLARRDQVTPLRPLTIRIGTAVSW